MNAGVLRLAVLYWPTLKTRTVLTLFMVYGALVKPRFRANISVHFKSEAGNVVCSRSRHSEVGQADAWHALRGLKREC
jgi:hypothetical protein